MTFPLAQTVGHMVYRSDVRNSRGNLVDAWDDPVDVRVYSWHVPSSHEPQIAGHERVVVQAVVLAPESFKPGDRDKIALPIGVFEVIGDVEDYNHGPFGWAPGNSINLKRVTG